MKNQTWILVANGSTARIYESAPNASETERIKQLTTFDHPETRVHGRDLMSGKAGRSFDRVGGGRHGLEPELTPQKNEAHHFAVSLADHLEHSRRIGDFNKLYLIASPSFLGMLRSVLHANTKDLIALEIDKDATSKTPEEIRAYLPFRL